MDKRILSYSSAGADYPRKLLRMNEVIEDFNLGCLLPIHLQLFPTNRCNLNCEICSFKDSDRKGDLDLSMLEVMLTDLRDIYEWVPKSVTITGGGEPLLYEDLELMSRLFRSCGIEMGLVSNGLLLPKIPLSFMRRLRWARISLTRESLTTGILDIMPDMLKSFPGVDWAFSFVAGEDRLENFKILRHVLFNMGDQITHMRVVNDLYVLDSRVSHLRSDAFEAGLGVTKVNFQERVQHTFGSKKCRISMIKPVIAPNGDIYPCCIHEDETVLIKSGSSFLNRRIKDVKPGDEVYGKGVIKNLWRKEVDGYYLITLKNNIFLKVSKDHLMVVANFFDVREKRKKLIDSYEKEILPAEDVKLGDLVPVLYNICFEDEEFKFSSFFEQDDFLWIAGKYLSEGWMQLRDKRHVGFAFGKHEKEYIEHMEEVFVKYRIHYKLYWRRTSAYFSCYDDVLCGLLQGFGHRGLVKRLPEYIFRMSFLDKEKLIKSFYEGDGCLVRPCNSYDNYAIRLGTVSSMLCSDLVLLLKSMGIFPSISIRKRNEKEMVIEGRRINAHDIYWVTVAGNYNLEKLSLFNEIILKERKSPMRALSGFKTEDEILIPIKSIEFIEEKATMYDIEVDGENEFYSSFGVLLHNCGFQYAIPNSVRGYLPQFKMGNIMNIKSFVEKKYFDGGLCHVCYYEGYNNFLQNFFEDIDHLEFI